jgi:hypothetical protein
MNFVAANHSSFFTRVCAQRNQTNIKISGAHRFAFGQLAVEHANAANQVTNPADLSQGNGWQVTQYDIDDASNLGVGDVPWSVVKGAVGQDTTFIVNGAANIRKGRVGTALA